MTTLDLFNELKSNGISVNLVKSFSYDIDKNRQYYSVNIDTVPTQELISIANRYNMMWVAKTYVNTDPEIIYSVKFEAMPKDMKSFNFVIE